MYFFNSEIFSKSGGGDRCGRIDFEGGEDIDTLIFADFGILITIDGSDSEDTIVLIDPLIKLCGKGL